MNFGHRIALHKCCLLELLDIVRSGSFEPGYAAMVFNANHQLAT